ncbi:MAG: putative DCC family thiol-disulfide oxidoreductase YuxK [Crocinitomicaceae bacterium]|jgi:predicted DCC family thiol-disulfide oxidoreductase YuxK
MEINQEISTLEVYYDGRCAMCGRFKNWLEQQELLIGVEFLSYASEAARERFPDLPEYKPDKAMVVRTDKGEIYRGAESIVMILWACSEYRKLAMKLRKPIFLPLASKIYPLIASNRYVISKLLTNEGKLKTELQKQKDECGDGSCDL